MSRVIENLRQSSPNRTKITCLQSRASSWPRSDTGQVTVFVAILFTLVLAAFAGFGVDMANLWFHRQSAQGAADSACLAGAVDLLANLGGGANGGFTPGTSFDCATATSAAPCVYAALNGYSSAGLIAAKTSNDVAVSFPGTVPGVWKPDVTVGGSFPYLRVDVVDRVKVYFSALTTQSKTMDVRATAKCGLVLPTGPGAIMVLHPNLASAFSIQGSPDVVITGGPPRGVVVDSSNVAAVTIGGSAILDLSQGGPALTGSDIGITGGPGTPYLNFFPGATGHWVSPSVPVPDPLKTVPPPALPIAPASPNPRFAGYGVNGCPDPTGCDEYAPGLYTTMLQIKNATAIFDPGIYYITAAGGLSLDSNSIVRPSTGVGSGAGDGSGGTLFYLSSGTVTIGSNAGTPKNNGTVDTYNSSLVSCPGGWIPNPPLPSTLQGNVLMAPCTTNGTYNTPPTPQGPYRGMLFFQNRSNTGTAALATLKGGGGLCLVGTEYFHNCPNSVTGTCSAPPLDYQAIVSLQGNSGTNTRVIGTIIADQLQLGGSSGINMELNPDGTFHFVKVALLQ
jgi:hypothetical protein